LIRRSWFDAIHNCWWRQRICRNGALPKRISSNWPARYPSTSRSLQTNHPRNAEPAAPDVFRENAEPCAEGCCVESIQVAQHGSGTRSRLGAAVALYRMRRAGCRFRGERYVALGRWRRRDFFLLILQTAEIGCYRPPGWRCEPNAQPGSDRTRPYWGVLYVRLSGRTWPLDL